jgi:hypothetical protein
MTNIDPTRDRFGVGYTLLFLAAFAALLSMFEFEQFSTGFGLALLVFIALVLFLLMRLPADFASHFWERRWRHAVSVLLAPFLATGIVGLLLKLGITPEWLHLQWEKPGYLQEIRAAEAGEAPVYKSWYWGGTGFVGTVQSERYIVYDESDAIAGSAEREGSGNCCSRDVDQIEGHFYLVTEWYNVN